MGYNILSMSANRCSGREILVNVRRNAIFTWAEFYDLLTIWMVTRQVHRRSEWVMVSLVGIGSYGNFNYVILENV